MAFLTFLLLATCFTAVSPTGYLPTVLAGAVFHRSRLEAWAVAYAQVRPAPRPAPTPPNSPRALPCRSTSERCSTRCWCGTSAARWVSA